MIMGPRANKLINTWEIHFLLKLFTVQKHVIIFQLATSCGCLLKHTNMLNVVFKQSLIKHTVL